jgi:hypothetical protein
MKRNLLRGITPLIRDAANQANLSDLFTQYP